MRDNDEEYWGFGTELDRTPISARLKELGLPSISVLHAAIRDGQLAGDFCSEAHPVYYAGCRVHAETNGGLRLRLAREGWSFDDTDNIPRAVSPDGSAVVTAMRGNAQTGKVHGMPAQTRRKRSSASVRIINRNGSLQHCLPGFEQETESDRRTGPTWFLLFHREKDEVRCEISLATRVSEEGGLLEWSERLILPVLDLNSPGTEGPDGLEPSMPDIDVPISRRTG